MDKKQEVQELDRRCLKQEQQRGRRLEKPKKPAALTSTEFTEAKLKHRAGGYIARAKKTKQTKKQNLYLALWPLLYQVL